jgi:hypothetical protein
MKLDNKALNKMIVLTLIGKNQMKNLTAVLSSVLLASCTTTQQLKLNTKSESSLENYKDKPASEFIYNRYIADYDSLGFGLINRGADYIFSGINKVVKSKEVESDIRKKYNLHLAFYNYADPSRLLRPKVELSKLCSVQGGSIKALNLFTRNIARENMNNALKESLTHYSFEYLNSAGEVKRFNSSEQKIMMTPDFGIPMYAKLNSVREGIVDRSEARSKSIKMSSFPSAFDEAIRAESFGVFECASDRRSLWKANITPLYVEKGSDHGIDLNTEVATIQISAND